MNSKNNINGLIEKISKMNTDEVSLNKLDFIGLLLYCNVPKEYYDHYLKNGYHFRGKKIKLL